MQCPQRAVPKTIGLHAEILNVTKMNVDRDVPHKKSCKCSD